MGSQNSNQKVADQKLTSWGSVLDANPQYRKRYGEGNVPQEMKAKGSVHTEAPSSVPEKRDVASEAPPVVKPAAPALEWEQVSNYAMRTKCKRYSCSKSGIAPNIKYTLWRILPDYKSTMTIIESFEAAKLCAQIDLESRQR